MKLLLDTSLPKIETNRSVTAHKRKCMITIGWILHPERIPALDVKGESSFTKLRHGEK